jgi:hypothetical protein
VNQVLGANVDQLAVGDVVEVTCIPARYKQPRIGQRGKVLVTGLPFGMATLGLGRPKREDEDGPVYLIRADHLRRIDVREV